MQGRLWPRSRGHRIRPKTAQPKMGLQPHSPTDAGQPRSSPLASGAEFQTLRVARGLRDELLGCYPDIRHDPSRYDPARFSEPVQARVRVKQGGIRCSIVLSPLPLGTQAEPGDRPPTYDQSYQFMLPIVTDTYNNLSKRSLPTQVILPIFSYSDC